MLDKLAENLKKEFGINFDYATNVDPGKTIPTGSISLDIATGVGGFPIGKLSEIFGPESSGKSTICISASVMAQKMGLGVVYLDAENSFQPRYAEKLGLCLDKSKFLLVQPDTAENGIEIIEYVVQDKSVGLVILDSIAAMVPTKESYGQGEVGDSHVGLVARLMAQFSRRITPIMKNNTSCALLMVNQVRENIGGGPYSALQTPGGRALKHAMSIRIKLGRKSTVKEVGNASIEIAAQVVKNKLSVPYRECEFDIKLGVGIDNMKEIAEILLEERLVKRSGSWYKDPNGENLGQGITSVYSWIENNKEIVKQILMERNVSDAYVN